MSNYNFRLEIEESWRDDVELYQPRDVEQILLPDNATCLAVKAFFKINNLHFKCIMCENAEVMLPTECELPLLKYGDEIHCGFKSIIDFVNNKKITTSSQLNELDLNEMRTYVCDINTNLLHAELYFTWLHDLTYKSITKQRYSFHLPWPLNLYSTWMKRNEIKNSLSGMPIYKLSVKEIYNNVYTILEVLSIKLSDNKFFYEKPTELDALVYGHLYAIITTDLPNELADIANKFENLVNLVYRMEKLYFEKKSGNI